MRILPCVEFRDGFNPCSSTTLNKGLFFHSLTLQSRDSTHDSFKCAYPVVLRHKTKGNMINVNTCVKDLNTRENSLNPFKVYSKKEGSCI